MLAVNVTIFSPKLTYPLQQSGLRRTCASAVRASEKISTVTNRKSTTRFPTSYRFIQRRTNISDIQTVVGQGDGWLTTANRHIGSYFWYGTGYHATWQDSIRLSSLTLPFCMYACFSRPNLDMLIHQWSIANKIKASIISCMAEAKSTQITLIACVHMRLYMRVCLRLFATKAEQTRTHTIKYTNTKKRIQSENTC